MTLMPGLKGKYDAWNRLVEVRDSVDNLIAEYSYNGLNQRISKKIGSTVIHSFFNENWQELESSTNDMTTSYVWGLRYIDDLILREKGAEKLYSLADPNWNVVALTDSSGAVQERMKYDAFGKISWLDEDFETKNNSDFDWNRTFTGQVLDVESGLMLYRNRFYHTGLGRFVSRDPIGYESKDYNLFRYCANMPLLHLDLAGTSHGDHEDRRLDEAGNKKKPGDLIDPATWCKIQNIATCLANAGIPVSGATLTACLGGCLFGGPTYPACVGACLGWGGGIISVATIGYCLWKYL